MRQIEHIVQIFLDIERPDPNPLLVSLPRKWVESRIEFFNQFTLRSLLNQSTQAFKIYLICGRRHREFTSKYPFHNRVTVVYPDGGPTIGATLTQSPTVKNKQPTTWIKEYLDSQSEFLAITRLDSDDMMAKHAMAEIISISQNIPLEVIRTRLLFRRFWKWHMMDRILEQQRKESPPFYTHIFPREVFTDWRAMAALHFNNHRFLGQANEHELPGNQVCVCSHQQNISRIKRGRPLKYMRSCDRKMIIKENPGSLDTRQGIANALAPFAVKRGEI